MRFSTLVRRTAYLLRFLCLISIPGSWAGTDASSVTGSEWKLVADREAIQIYSMPVPGSPINAVRAEMIVSSDLSQVAAILYDTERRPDWDDLCVQSYVHKTVTSDEYLVYIHTRLPWPFKDRDTLGRVIWSQDPVTKIVSMRSDATSGLMPLHEDRVRVETATNRWELQPLKDGSTRVSVQIHVDPGAPLPAWLINRLSVESPFGAMKNIREIAVSEGVTYQEPDFIVPHQ